MSESKEGFESWGLLELMGRQRIAGRMSEQVIAAGTYLRIDVPGIGRIPEHTRYFGHAAIYGITPTTEEVARELAAGLQSQPISTFDLPVLRQQKLFDTEDHGD